MADNPKAALDAVLEDEKEVGGLKIWPLTLGRYALLELVESPFVCKDAKFSTYQLIPTFYVMTRSPAELKGYTSGNVDSLVEKAFEWAETEDIKDSAAIVDELLRKFELVGKVRPEVPEDPSKKKADPHPTGGSPASPSGR